MTDDTKKILLTCLTTLQKDFLIQNDPFIKNIKNVIVLALRREKIQEQVALEKKLVSWTTPFSQPEIIRAKMEENAQFLTKLRAFLE